MEKPVRGSPFFGIAGFISMLGRIWDITFSWAIVPLARLASIRILRIFSLMPMGASEVVSTPPAMPDSMWPSAILLATSMAASRPVPQACWRS